MQVPLIEIPYSVPYFLDFDETLVFSLDAVCELYAKRFSQLYQDLGLTLPRSIDIQEWNLNQYFPFVDNALDFFRDEEMFKILKPMEDPQILLDIAKKRDTTIVTLGTHQNIELKSRYISKTWPGVKTVYIYNGENSVANKSIINMQGGLLADDNKDNLLTSNADYKFIFGIERNYNKNSGYNRIYSLKDLDFHP